MSVVEIRREICVVYGQWVMVMGEGTVRQWCRMFKDGRMVTMKSEVVGRSSVMSDDLVQNVEQKICERQFHNFRNFMHTIGLGHYNFCARCFPKMLTAHET
jgi:hypothetical protein